MSPVHFGSASPPWVLVACNFLAIWLNGRRRIVAYSERESAAVQCKNSFALITVFVLAILAPSVACTVRDRPATSGFVVRVLLMLAAVWSVLGLHASHQIDVGTAQFVTHMTTLHLLCFMSSCVHKRRSLLVMGGAVYPVLVAASVLFPGIFLLQPSRLPGSLVAGLGIFAGHAAVLASDSAARVLREAALVYESWLL